MKVVILGATGQIGRCLLRHFAVRADVVALARRPEAAQAFLDEAGLPGRAAPIESLRDETFDVLINAIGDGTPKGIAASGFDILSVTERFDRLCLAALTENPDACYVFFSTGAVYGKNYAQARVELPVLDVPLRLTEAVSSSALYAFAKLAAEYRHRAYEGARIADVRLFGFVSSELDDASDFFVAQAFRSIASGQTLIVTAHDVLRDYVDEEALTSFLDHVLAAGCPTDSYDLVSAGPTSKLALLDALSARYGLRWEARPGCVSTEQRLTPPSCISSKPAAPSVGYAPTCSSVDAVFRVGDRRFQRQQDDRAVRE